MTLSAWNELYHHVNGRTTLGEAGVRDPEHPCDTFLPGTPDGDCQSDGHYLCGECAHREIGCIICTMHRVRCDCRPCDRSGCYDTAVFVEVGHFGAHLCLDHAEMLTAAPTRPVHECTPRCAPGFSGAFPPWKHRQIINRWFDTWRPERRIDTRGLCPWPMILDGTIGGRFANTNKRSR